MPIQTSTLRPGLLVSLKTSVVGNVKYFKNEIEPDHLTEEGARKAKWETERTIIDPVEHENGIKARSKARGAITKVCTDSAFGLLCPESDKEELEAGIKEARAIADAFNATATLTRLHVYIMIGRVASDDVEAVKAINSEVRTLLEDMQLGLKNLDVKAIRKASYEVKALGSMLSPEANVRIELAIEAARSAAKKIVQAGETAAAEIDKRAIRAVTEARTAFLDLDDAKEIKAPGVDQAALDFAPAAPIKAAAAPSAQIEV